MTPESWSKTIAILGDIFLTCWSFWGCFFGRLLVTFWCPEAIHNEKGEHVTFDDSCTFSHDFQRPQGTENDTF